MHWRQELSYFITAKSGPLRSLRTLADVRSAWLDDLPRPLARREPWPGIGRRLVALAATGSAPEIAVFTDTLLQAITAEGWLTRVPAVPAPAIRPARDACLRACLMEISRQLAQPPAPLRRAA